MTQNGLVPGLLKACRKYNRCLFIFVAFINVSFWLTNLILVRSGIVGVESTHSKKLMVHSPYARLTPPPPTSPW